LNQNDMPQHDKKSPTQDSASKDATQGLSLVLAEIDDPMHALEIARDYRGDTTIHLKDGTSLNGFAFDVQSGEGSGPALRMDLPDEGRMSIASDRIERIELDGRDMAAGKTWENWVRRYAEKRLAGEVASIESAPLD
tara:strand:+ start:770 stop:1180 length:411 start_codon:yes stop_codon:yes gene_type:complete